MEAYETEMAHTKRLSLLVYNYHPQTTRPKTICPHLYKYKLHILVMEDGYKNMIY